MICVDHFLFIIKKSAMFSECLHDFGELLLVCFLFL